MAPHTNGVPANGADDGHSRRTDPSVGPRSGDHPLAGRGRHPGWAPFGAAVAGAVIVPLALHAAGLDGAVPVLVWLAAAGLLRYGDTLTDRLVLAGAALCAAACVAGLLFSIWPWHLAPLPVGIVAGAVLVLYAGVTGRRPTFRLPVAARDVAVWCAAASGAAIAGVPLLRASGSSGRLALALPGEDLSRHFVIYDGIGRLGGYLFLRPGAARTIAPDYIGYPQGSHFVLALLDGFVTGGRPPGSTLVGFDHYLVWTGLTFAAFGGCLMWAAGWLLRRVPRDWWVAPLYALVLAAGVWTIGAQLLGRGYPSELAGLALFAVALALVVTAAAEPWSGDRLLLTAAAVVGLCFVYHLYLLPLIPVLSYVAWVGRRQMWEHRRATLVIAVLAAGFAAVMPLVNVFSLPVDQALHGGPVIPVGRGAVLALTLGVAAPFAARVVTRHPVWRAAAVALAGAVAFAAAMAAYQWGTLHALSYYFEKALHGLVVTELVIVGVLGALLAGGAARAGAQTGRRRSAERAAVGGLAAVAVLAAFGVLAPGPATVAPSFLALPAGNFGRAYMEGRLAMPQEGRGALGAYRAERAGATGRLVLFWGAYSPPRDYYTEQFANALDRHFDARTWLLVHVYPTAVWSPPRSVIDASLAALGGTPTTIYTRQAIVRDVVATYVATHPASDIQVRSAHA